MAVFNKRDDYYSGKHVVLSRIMDVGRPNNKIVENLCNTIVDFFAGYAVGLPVTYTTDDEMITDELRYNDVVAQDLNFYKDALIYGRGAEVHYIDEAGQARFTTVDPSSIIPVYSDDLEHELLYVIRLVSAMDWALNQETFFVELYDIATKRVYASQPGWNSLSFISEEPHHYNQVPFCIFQLDKNAASACDQIYSLQDALDSILSDSLNEVDAFVNAYLVLQGVTANAEDLADMKKNRCILLDNDSNAFFLTRDINQTSISATKKDIEERMFQIAGAVDISDEKFGTSSGIALRYKLLPTETKTSVWLDLYKKALQKRIELIAWINGLKGDSAWADVKIEFTRNIPVDATEYANTVSTLRGTVSTETLLQLLPFVSDPQEEMKRLKAEEQDSIDIFAGRLAAEAEDGDNE